MDLKYVSFVRYRFVPMRTFNVTKGILKFSNWLENVILTFKLLNLFYVLNGEMSQNYILFVLRRMDILIP